MVAAFFWGSWLVVLVWLAGVKTRGLDTLPRRRCWKGFFTPALKKPNSHYALCRWGVGCKGQSERVWHGLVDGLG